MKIAAIRYSRDDGEGPGATLEGVDGTEVCVSKVYLLMLNPKEGGYFVLYDDGYRSYSPAEPFEAGYTPIKD